MGSHSPLRQQHRAWLRGGGEGKQEARIPEDALGVMSSKGLQLRPVRWPDEGPSLAPETNTTEVSALRRPGAEDTGEDSNSFSSEATSEDYQAAEPGLTEIKPAQAELWAASRDGDGAAIDRLVKACGADIDAHDPEFGLWTACHYAACAGRLRIMQTLWRLGADIDACNGAGSAPLCLAASEGHLSLVQKLVSWGADINATNLQGSSALHGAAFNGARELVKSCWPWVLMFTVLIVLVLLLSIWPLPARMSTRSKCCWGGAQNLIRPTWMAGRRCIMPLRLDMKQWLTCC